jgi:hypothetical protein
MSPVRASGPISADGSPLRPRAVAFRVACSMVVLSHSSRPHPTDRQGCRHQDDDPFKPSPIRFPHEPCPTCAPPPKTRPRPSLPRPSLPVSTCLHVDRSDPPPRPCLDPASDSIGSPLVRSHVRGLPNPLGNGPSTLDL